MRERQMDCVSAGYRQPDAAARVEAHIPELYRFARALCRGDRERAEDLVQDCLERALSCWQARRSDGNLRGWLYTILYRRFLNEERRRRRRGESRRLGEALETELPGIDGGQDAAIQHRDLVRAFAALPPEQRAVVLRAGRRQRSHRAAASRVPRRDPGAVSARPAAAGQIHLKRPSRRT
jgi:RNA polymerase sigma-70 factor (ECF subfamily)